MTEKNTLKCTIEKICQETDCADKIGALNKDQLVMFKDFTYCPYCAEEMTLVCQSCREQLVSGDYKFCPWCGCEFTD